MTPTSCGVRSRGRDLPLRCVTGRLERYLVYNNLTVIIYRVSKHVWLNVGPCRQVTTQQAKRRETAAFATSPAAPRRTADAADVSARKLPDRAASARQHVMASGRHHTAAVQQPAAESDSDEEWSRILSRGAQSGVAKQPAAIRKASVARPARATTGNNVSFRHTLKQQQPQRRATEAVPEEGESSDDEWVEAALRSDRRSGHPTRSDSQLH